MAEQSHDLPARPPAGGLAGALPKYRSHKIVEAAKIVQILELHDGAWLGVDVGAVGLHQLRVSSEYLRKHQPKEGGYFVRYHDGYESWSPAEAFESGYTRIDDVAGGDPASLRAGLEKLVRLSSHYAKLLNQYDGGQRRPFANADEWLARLDELRADVEVKGGEIKGGQAK